MLKERCNTKAERGPISGKEGGAMESRAGRKRGVGETNTYISIYVYMHIYNIIYSNSHAWKCHNET